MAYKLYCKLAFWPLLLLLLAIAIVLSAIANSLIAIQYINICLYFGIVFFFSQVVLETEITNKPALRLYENLGFVRDKRLFRYYLNGVDALRLKLWLRWYSAAITSWVFLLMQNFVKMKYKKPYGYPEMNQKISEWILIFPKDLYFQTLKKDYYSFYIPFFPTLNF